MQEFFVNIKAFPSSTGTQIVEEGWLYGSVYNKGTSDITMLLDGETINLASGTIYNFEFLGKPYMQLTINAGTNTFDAVFHY